jgi:nitrite reductase/ring-hydroxylating ferredoxin subunit
MTDENDGWVEVLTLDALPDGRPTRVDLGGAAVLVVRDGGRLFAIADRCSHQGAPLHKGPVRFSGSLATTTCPVHGSQFALDTGKVIRGPATSAVSAYDARVNEGIVEIRDRA